MSLFWYRKRVEALAAGTLEGAEERKVREHVRGCDACRAHYDRAVKVRLAVGGEGVRRERDEELLARLPFPGREPEPRRGFAPALIPAVAAVLVAMLVAVLWHPWTRGDDGLRGGDEGAAPLQARLYREQASGKAELLGELPGTSAVRVHRGERVQLSARGAGEVTATLGDLTLRIEASTKFQPAGEAWTVSEPGELVVTDAAGHRVSCRVELEP